jgi:hypothetical protein
MNEGMMPSSHHKTKQNDALLYLYRQWRTGDRSYDISENKESYRTTITPNSPLLGHMDGGEWKH